MEQRLNRLPSSPRSHFPPVTWLTLPQRQDVRHARDAEAEVVRERHQLKLKPVLTAQAGPLLELAVPLQVLPAAREPQAGLPEPSW